MGRSGERRSGISVLQARHDDDGTNVFPCNTPATMSKKTVSPPGERTLHSCFYRVLFHWVDRRQEVFAPFMESNDLEKSTSRSVGSRFFKRSPRIRQIVRICDVVDRFRRPGKTYRQQLGRDMGCGLKDLPEAMVVERELRKLLQAKQHDVYYDDD